MRGRGRGLFRPAGSLWRGRAPVLLLALSGVLAPRPGRAQDAGQLLASVTPENAVLYLSPVADALAGALATGTLPSLRPRPMFNLSVGIRLTLARVPSGGRSFAPSLPESVVYGGAVHQDPFVLSGPSTPTVAGMGSGGRISPRPGSSFEAAISGSGLTPGDFALDLPAGLDFSRPWTPLLEATLGVGLGTDLVARFAPTVAWSGALGDASVFGVTLVHTLDPYLRLGASPVDARLTGSLQRIKAGGYMEVLGTSLGLAVGGRVGEVELYGHGRLEDSRTRIIYEVANPRANPALPPHGSRVDTEVTGRTRFRAGVGAVIPLPSMVIHMEVSPGSGPALGGRLSLPDRRRPGAR